MSESTIPVTELASQYIAQVTNDLERNVKEQERIGAEIIALQEQLAVLQHDHSVLANMQQALGVPAAPAAPAEAEPVPDSAVVPAPRQKTTAEPPPPNPPRTPKSAPPGRPAATRKQSAKKPADKAEAAPSSQPTLVELVRRHLSEQSEPRSAAEVTAALGQAHPDRNVKTTVVRTTLEGLVAKNQAHRSKQGTSVYYTAADTSAPARAGEPAASSESTDG
ncbi:hypothetical protein [Streptomyces sp. NPDC058964]|uniref:hypothetical protein n=1 Tax=Streptomyces sp. NPDC058964 TaxID=3346681 RepID=UPI0036A07604